MLSCILGPSDRCGIRGLARPQYHFMPKFYKLGTNCFPRHTRAQDSNVHVYDPSQHMEFLFIFLQYSLTEFALTKFVVANFHRRLCQLRLEPFQTEGFLTLTLFQRTDNERNHILILRDKNMLEGIYAALSFAQFIRQPPDCGSEHGQLRDTQQNLAEGSAGFIQNGGSVTRTIEQFRWLATRGDYRDRHAHDAAQLEVDIDRFINRESCPFHMITTHNQSGLFHGIISGLKQCPYFLLNYIGFLCYADKLAGQCFTLTVEDLIPFLRKAKFLL